MQILKDVTGINLIFCFIVHLHLEEILQIVIHFSHVPLGVFMCVIQCVLYNVFVLCLHLPSLFSLQRRTRN